MASRSRSAPLRPIARFLVAFSLVAAPAMAANVSFTVSTSEPVVVTGTPRIAIDVGGLTRHATYASGSGTPALVFSYAVQQGDFDPDGITVASPLDLNGGAITDLAGNPLSSLAFTVPDTTNLKVQTYTAAFSAITNSNAGAASFTISKAPTGATFTYTISTSGGTNALSGSGTISGLTHTVPGLDLSSFPQGTLAVSVTVGTAAGVQGAARTATTTPTFTGVLDGLPATAASYSLRRLRAAYTGALVRVRRSSDNAERDIGATIGGNLDTGSLSTFCGSGSCFVSTWYDQSGSGNNAVQATAANQFRIVSGGTIERNGASRVALRTTTSNSAISAISPPLANTADITILAAAQSNSFSGFGPGSTLFAMFIQSPVQVSSNAPWSNAGIYFDLGNINTNARISGASGITAGRPYVASFGGSVSGATQFVRTDGILRASDTSGQSTTVTGLTLMNGFTGNAQNGTISEFMVFPTLLSTTNIQTLEQSMGQAWGP